MVFGVFMKPLAPGDMQLGENLSLEGSPPPIKFLDLKIAEKASEIRPECILRKQMANIKDPVFVLVFKHPRVGNTQS